ncbi:TnsA endonuclease N-terminal domain-containing protein [Sphingomonas arantia]|uniref:TnsA endonuclease N-terminal domain-containing protein n=2 Tax=Sphingomonas arantia TaxID=1460676 RepID=A0ABW4U0J8_9SPHN
MRGILHDRVLHLMSDLERNAVLHFERQGEVVDIREQFPLDRGITRAIANSMGVRHPTDPASKVQIVMTTDLLITCRPTNGPLVSRAFSIKEGKDLLSTRVMEKQEIERRYWQRLGVSWNLMLDNILRDGPRFEAIRWIRDWFYVDGVGGHDPRCWNRRRRRVLEALSVADGTTLGEFTASVSAGGGFAAGEVLSTLRHLAARRLVGFDPSLGVPTLSSPLSRFQPLDRPHSLGSHWSLAA